MKTEDPLTRSYQAVSKTGAGVNSSVSVKKVSEVVLLRGWSYDPRDIPAVDQPWQWTNRGRVIFLVCVRMD